MDSYQIYVWDHVFSFPMHTESIPKKTINVPLKDKFSGDSEISTSANSLLFLNKYLSCRIIYPSHLCRLFAWKWFKTFKTNSIQSWVHFQTLFISAHKNYDYDQL